MAHRALSGPLTSLWAACRQIEIVTLENAYMLVIPERDDDFKAWINQNPGGYVINANKTSGTAMPMYWHRADCIHVRWDDHPEAVWVQGDHLKICSLDPGELAAWTKSRPEPLNYCMTCRDKFAKEHPPSP